MLDKRIFLLVFLLIPMTSTLDINDTLFINPVTNFSVYINETVTFSGINVTDAGRIEFFGLDTTSTIGKFWNINATYNSTIDIHGLTNSLIYYSNGTIILQEFTGDINIVLPVLSSAIVMNNYVINDTATTPSNDPISSGGGGGNTKVNNTLLDDLIIQIQNLDRSFIFMSNTTILKFLSGSLNITLSSDDYFYIVDYEELLAFNENSGTTAHDLSGNSNDGTITGATWATDGVLNTLTAITDYTINTATGLFTIVNDDFSWSQLFIDWSYTVSESRNDLENIKGNYSKLLVNEADQLPTVGTIIGIAILLVVLISLLIFAIRRINGIGNIGNGSGGQKFKGSSQGIA